MDQGSKNETVFQLPAKMTLIIGRSVRKFLLHSYELGALYYCFGQNPGARGEHLAIQLLWATARQLITNVGPIYLVDEFGH